MNLNAIKQVGTRGLGRAVLVGKKYAPEILTATGVVGVVTAAVMGARATLKLEDVLNKIDEGKEVVAHNDEQDGYTPEQRKKDMIYIYTRGTVDIAKLYGPAVTLGVASLAMILSSHGIMRRRNAGLVAAYKVLETSYKEYRDRVAEHIGADEERDLYRGVSRKEVTEDGKKRTKFEQKVDMMNLSPYAREFDETNLNWTFVNDQNLFWLRAQENYANDRLKSKGFLFLNDVYDQLGIPRTSEGQLVGWLADGPDGYVSFDLPEKGGDEELDYLYWARPSIMLDFNVDGVVYDKI